MDAHSISNTGETILFRHAFRDDKTKRKQGTSKYINIK